MNPLSAPGKFGDPDKEALTLCVFYTFRFKSSESWEEVIQQTFTEYLLYTRQCSNIKARAVKSTQDFCPLGTSTDTRS